MSITHPKHRVGTETLRALEYLLNPEEERKIVDDRYLMDNLALSKSFIDRNAKAMGSFGRPRRFFLQYVMNHLNGLALKSMDKVNSKAARQNERKSEVNRLFEDVIKRQGNKQRN